MNKVDLVIVGGGLAGCLLAVAARKYAPNAKVLLIEQDARLGGNHRWSYFDTDLDAEGHKLLEGINKSRWDRYEVRFPAYTRTLDTPYNSFDSAALDRWVRTALSEDRLISGDPVVTLAPTKVVLASQKSIEAKFVVNARGPSRTAGLRLGWQKFIGCEFDIAGHGVSKPIVMDATVDQNDGYRFVYVLPLSENRLFLEDTYYSDAAGLDDASIMRGLESMAMKYGAAPKLVSQERGVLPIVIDGHPEQFWPETDDVHRIGMAAGLFHPLTGYSLPFCVATALDLAKALAAGTPLAKDYGRSRFISHWRRSGYYRLLSKMLFGAAQPGEQFRIFEHFYRLHQPLIERFYGGRSTLADKARILIGKPPVPIGRAIQAIFNREKAGD